MGALRDERFWRTVLGAAALLLLTGFWSPSRAETSPMAFRLAPLTNPGRCGKTCVDVISAEGEIVDSTPQDYLDFLDRHLSDPNLRVVVFLTSPGGKVVASMQFGELLRKSGAAVIVERVRPPVSDLRRNAEIEPGVCYSACVYALMGGKKRVVPPHSVAGIHRMFDYEDPPGSSGFYDERRKVYDARSLEETVAWVERYAGEMGVSPALVAEAERVSSDSIHIVTPAEMRRWRLAVRKF